MYGFENMLNTAKVAQQPSGGGFNFGNLAKFAGSPGGSSLISAGIGALGAGMQAKAAADAQKRQDATRLAMFQQQFPLQRAVMASSMGPLGWDQNFLQQQGMKQMYLDRLERGSQPFIPSSVKGVYDAAGYQMPTGMKMGDDYRKAFDFNTSLGSIANWQGNISNVGGGQAPVVDMARYAANSPYIQQMQNWNTGQQALASRNMANLQAAIDGQQKKQGGGVWSKIGGVLKAAAPIAAFAIPGIGPLVGAGIAAGMGAAGTKMQGGSWKDAALGGGLDFATGGALSRIPGLSGRTGRIVGAGLQGLRG